MSCGHSRGGRTYDPPSKAGVPQHRLWKVNATMTYSDEPANAQKQAGAGPAKPKDASNPEVPSWLKDRIQVLPVLVPEPGRHLHVLKHVIQPSFIHDL